MTKEAIELSNKLSAFQALLEKEKSNLVEEFKILHADIRRMYGELNVTLWNLEDKLPNISASTWNGTSWGGWSNSKTGSHSLLSLKDAVRRVKNDPELAYVITDADQKIIWLSDMNWEARAVMHAHSNFGVTITDIRLGFPNE